MSEAIYVQANDENGDVHYVPLADVDPKRAARDHLFGELVDVLECWQAWRESPEGPDVLFGAGGKALRLTDEVLAKVKAATEAP